VPSLRPALHEAESALPGQQRAAWQLWDRWISEIVADFWSIAKLVSARPST